MTEQELERTLWANLPCDISGWGGEHLRSDDLWKYGMLPTRNANLQQRLDRFHNLYRRWYMHASNKLGRFVRFRNCHAIQKIGFRFR